MSDRDSTKQFLRSTFTSVWSLELLLLLRQRPDHDWSEAELVEALRASKLVVSRSLQSLVAAALVVPTDDGGARYARLSRDTEKLIAEAESMYARSPDAVRRLIIEAGMDPAAKFADAFRFRKE